MSTRESLEWDAHQDRIAEDRHERALCYALANKASLVSDLLAHLEANPVEAGSCGGLTFETQEDGLACEVVFDRIATGGIDATIWADDNDGMPVELARVRITVGVLP